MLARLVARASRHGKRRASRAHVRGEALPQYERSHSQLILMIRGSAQLSQQEEVPDSELPEYSLAEVAEHNQPEREVWIVVQNRVYDVTDFLAMHPGGTGLLMAYAGRDATRAFVSTKHSDGARRLLGFLCIGIVQVLLGAAATTRLGAHRPTHRHQNGIATWLLDFDR